MLGGDYSAFEHLVCPRLICYFCIVFQFHTVVSKDPQTNPGSIFIDPYLTNWVATGETSIVKRQPYNRLRRKESLPGFITQRALSK